MQGFLLFLFKNLNFYKVEMTKSNLLLHEYRSDKKGKLVV